MALLDELGAYGACDPAKVEETRRAVTLAKEAAIRWTGAFQPTRLDWRRNNKTRKLQHARFALRKTAWWDGGYGGCEKTLGS